MDTAAMQATASRLDHNQTQSNKDRLPPESSLRPALQATTMEVAVPKVGYEIVDVEANTDENNSDSVVAAAERHKGTVLEWRNIEYAVPASGSETAKTGEVMKPILHSMSGKALPGELLAIMGTSGAGKSTLLDVLAGRLESPNLKGMLTTNNMEVNKATFRKESGYVMQSDALFPLLTVRETIRYAAELRIADKTRAEKHAMADRILSLLRLDKCADTIIGDETNRGLSGGEKRRVSIAVDIVHSPAIIFLDEPTSGLDSSTALSVVESLRALARQQNCTVIMTIHQPSARLFSCLDRALFLSMGHVAYSGAVTELPAFSAKISQQAELGDAIPQGNPPEVFLDLCDQLHTKQKFHLVTDPYTNTTHSSRNLYEHDSPAPAYANSTLAEIYILLHRSLHNILRTPELFFARLGSAVFFGVLIGTLFLHTKDTTEGLQHRMSYLVFAIAFFYYTSLEALPIFLGEREIFQREYSRGAYRAVSYVLSSQLVQLPFLLAVSTAFVSITWFVVGLPPTAEAFFFMIFSTFTVMAAGNAAATLMSVLVPNPMVGQTAGSALFSVMFLFSGFFIVRDDIPDYWIWLHYTSLFKYAYDSMVVNAFKDHVTTDTMSNAEILEQYSVDGVNRGQGLGILWGWILVFRMMFYYRLVKAFNGSRR